MHNDVSIDQSSTITWLNLSGDITITWDESNADKIRELVKQKMAAGYTFFTTKRYMFGTITKLGRVQPRDVKNLNDLIITDEQFEKLCADIADPDVAALLRANQASPARRLAATNRLAEKGRETQIVKRAQDVDDVVGPGKQSVAVRPIAGG